MQLGLIILSLALVRRVSTNLIWGKGHRNHELCPYSNAVEVGREKDHELKETSGLVASNKNPGVFYAIQDSLNPDPVYSINKQGDLLGMLCTTVNIFLIMNRTKTSKYNKTATDLNEFDRAFRIGRS